MREFLKSINSRPISYFPIYRDITGSVTGAVLLSQLMYWLSKKDKIFKTDAEIMAETHLTQNELRAAKTKLKSVDFITVSREGIPAKTYYSIDWEKYETSLVNFTKLDELNSLNSDSEVHETINENQDIDYTETTTESNLSVSFFFSDHKCNGKGGKCKRKSAMTINGKHYCSQHGRMILAKLGKLDLLKEPKKENSHIDIAAAREAEKLLSEKHFVDAAEMKYPLNEDAYAEWLDYRASKRKPVSLHALKLQVRMLCRYDLKTQKEIIDTSIQNDYQGLFEPKTYNQHKNFKEPEVGSIGWLEQQAAEQRDYVDVEVSDADHS